MRWLFDLYVPDAADRLNWEVAPLRATSLVGVAPALVITAEHDMLREEAEEYARRMLADGVPVEVNRYPGQIHGFVQMLQLMDDAHDAVEASARAVRRAFAG